MRVIIEFKLSLLKIVLNLIILTEKLFHLTKIKKMNKIIQEIQECRHCIIFFFILK